MADETKTSDQTAKDTKGKFPFSLTKIAAFISNMFRLDRDVTTLTEKCKRLEEKTAQMQRQLDEQSGQLKQLSQFLHDTLYDRIDTRAEKAALGLIENILAATSATSKSASLSAPKKRPKK